MRQSSVISKFKRFFAQQGMAQTKVLKVHDLGLQFGFFDAAVIGVLLDTVVLRMGLLYQIGLRAWHLAAWRASIHQDLWRLGFTPSAMHVS